MRTKQKACWMILLGAFPALLSSCTKQTSDSILVEVRCSRAPLNVIAAKKKEYTR
jgi:hypothetical protein